MELQEIDKTNFLIITFSKKACCDFMEKGDNVKKNIFSIISTNRISSGKYVINIKTIVSRGFYLFKCN